MRGVGDLGVKLHTKKRFGGMFNRGVRARVGGRGGNEVLPQVFNLVAVAHPHAGVVGQAVKQARFVLNVKLSAAVFARICAFDFGTQKLASHLHAIANAQHRNA